MKLRSVLSIIGSVILAWLAAAPASAKDLETVPYVDVDRYMGVWYEVASIPQIFSLGCVGSTAQYSISTAGDVIVYNSCWVGSFHGPRRSVLGRAWIADSTTNAKLKVKFAESPVEGDYWILELDEQYQYAVVGHPSRKSGWILSRTPQLPPDVYQELMRRLRVDHGYDTLLFSKTRQPKN